MSELVDDAAAAPGAELAVAGPADAVEPVDGQPADVDANAEPGDGKVIYASITAVGERKPIIPPPLQRANLRGTVEQYAGLTAHRAGYHGVRWPWYLIAVAAWSVVGLFRLVIRQIHWLWLLEAHELKTDAVLAGNPKEYRSLHAMQVKHREKAFTLLGVEAVAALVASIYLTVWAPWPVQAGAVAVAGILAARFGRPAGHRIVGTAVVPAQFERLTRSIVVEALASIGISAITRAIKDGPGVVLLSDPYRDGPGWGVQLDLPRGVTAQHVIARRPELASALRRPLSATWPEGVPAEHEGRLSLWVGFHDISKTKPPKYPLLKQGATDFFGRIPYGVDPRGRPITVPLFEVNWLFGSAPGQGKTNALRNLLCGIGLDPLVELWVHEHSGKGDLEPFAQICHRYAAGLDDDSIVYAAESLRLLVAELERRSKKFGALPGDVKREGKMSRELALRLRDLRPLVCVIDECQNLFMHPVHGEQAAKDAAYVIRVGRAYGICVELATQRPDKTSLPPAIRDIMTGRACLHVPDQVSNDMILGTGSYSCGYNATLFRFGVDLGVCWLKADGPPQIVRTYKIDLPDADKVAGRGRAMRDNAGLLGGYALGVVDDAPSRDVLADLAAVFGDDSGLQWADAANRLAERWPDRWADLSADALSAQCRNLGIKSQDVRRGESVLKGCRRVAVEAARQ